MPTSPIPYNESVDMKDIVFSCNTLSSSPITKSRLMISSENKELYITSSAVEATAGTTRPMEISYENNRIIWDVSNFKRVQTSDGLTYSVDKVTNSRKNHIDGEIDNGKYMSVSGIIDNDTPYSWSMRLYDDIQDNKKPSIQVGYGKIDSVRNQIFNEGSKMTDSERFHEKLENDHTYTTLKIQPIDLQVKNSLSAVGGEISNIITSEIENKYSARYDDFAEYYIKINGKFYPVYIYTFYDCTNEDVISNSLHVCEGATNDDVDSYGDPLYGYVVINGDYPISAGSEYIIYSNYIDTKEYYFETSTAPNIRLFDMNNVEITNDILDIDYSNFKFTAAFYQNEGAIVNYYSIKLYHKNSFGIFEPIYNSKIIYNSNIEFEYDNFITENTYKVVLTIVDSNGVSSEKSIVLNVSYPLTVSPLTVNVTHYPKHNSLIVDWSKIKSIYPGYLEEAYYQYTEENNTNVCHIDKGKYIEYTSSNSDLTLPSSPTVYMTIKLDGSAVDIADITDDNGYIYKISWDGVYFVIKTGKTEDSANIVKYSPYVDWNGTNFYGNKLFNNLGTDNPKYDVPYLWRYPFEDRGEPFDLNNYSTVNPFERDFYWHKDKIESIWWTIVISRERVYIKNITDKSDWIELR